MADLDKEFVEYVVKALVTKPEAVEVRRSVDDMGVLLELTVDPADMGKVIGRAGATAKSIRTLLRVLGAQSDERVNLKILEPEGGEVPVSEASESDEDSEAAVSEAPQPEVGAEADDEAEPEVSPEHQALVDETREEFSDVDDLDL